MFKWFNVWPSFWRSFPSTPQTKSGPKMKEFTPNTSVNIRTPELRRKSTERPNSSCLSQSQGRPPSLFGKPFIPFSSLPLICMPISQRMMTPWPVRWIQPWAIPSSIATGKRAKANRIIRRTKYTRPGTATSVSCITNQINWITPQLFSGGSRTQLFGKTCCGLWPAAGQKPWWFCTFLPDLKFESFINPSHPTPNSNCFIFKRS